MRIALCQTKIAFENRQENLADAERLLDRERGKGRGSFPVSGDELYRIFYEYSENRGAVFGYAVGKCADWRKKYGAALGFGWVSAPEGGRGEENAGKAEITILWWMPAEGF